MTRKNHPSLSLIAPPAPRGAVARFHRCVYTRVSIAKIERKEEKRGREETAGYAIVAEKWKSPSLIETSMHEDTYNTYLVCV